MNRFNLYQRDAFEWLSTLPSESVDLVITDPPYESMEKHRATGTTTRLKHSTQSSNDWFKTIPNARLPELFEQFYRVLKKNTHCYFMCDQETMFLAKPIGEDAGFTFWKPLVWDKKKIGMGYHYRARHEFVLFFEKGKRRLNDLGIGDVLEVTRIKGKDKWPTEKPPALSEILIRQSTQPGELVMDPFMGSGSVGVAALRLNRCFQGNDVNPASIDLAGRRLREVVEGVANDGQLMMEWGT